MTRPTLISVLLALLALGGCARAVDPGPADPAEEAAGRRAALAAVTVDNRTPHRLAIAFRPAASAGGEVVIGRVEPGDSVRLAPVPAGEPLILLARTPDGATLSLPPRTFALDERWTWRIPPDADFAPAEGAT
jgi:hypothetical protein